MPKFESNSTVFGSLRHEMFLEESRKTGLTPVAFGRFSLPVDIIEEEFETEIIPGVVLHSRPDAVSLSEFTVVDYKTKKQLTNIKVADRDKAPSKYFDLDLKPQYRLIKEDMKKGIEIPGIESTLMPVNRHAGLLRNDRQLSTYAYQLYAKGHVIKKSIYMVEVWDREELKILGYDYLEKDITLTDIMVNKKWLAERAMLLASALRAHQMV